MSIGRIVFCVCGDDHWSGRAEHRAAAELGSALAERGYDVVFADRERWSDLPTSDLVVALAPAFDPAGVPGGTPVVAWALAEPDAWSRLGGRSLYDAVLAGSWLARDRLAEVYDGPVGVLPMGVNVALFTPDPGVRRLPRAVATAHEARQLADVELPDLYRRSLVVVDEMSSTALAYGARSGRLFESLACGAMPVTNGALGLADVGLEEVPVFRTVVDLDRVVRELCADPEATTRTASRLGEMVRTEHSWERRAAAFLGHVQPLLDRARAGRMTPRPPTVGFFPDYGAGNPYQRLLYADLPARGVGTVPIDISKQLVPRDTGGRLDDYLLHVHWTAPLLQSLRGPFEAELGLRRFRQRLDDFQRRGGRLVWTIHNVLPHECPNRAAELALREFLADRADLIHVLGADTARIVAPFYRLPAARTVVIPHSSYIGVYPDVVGREEARRRLGLREHEIALLTFGGIRPYKGLGLLLDVFEVLSHADPRLRLLVVGKPGNFPEWAQWRQRCDQHPRIVAHFDHANDSDLQVWCRAADLAVLPYATILNSGSFQLALSFDLPVVAPHDGSLAALLDPAYSVAFTPGSAADLSAALDAAFVRLVGRPEVRQAANAAARSYPPDAMAGDFADAVLPLLAGAIRETA